MSMYQPRRLWLTAGEPGNQAAGIVSRNHDGRPAAGVQYPTKITPWKITP